MRNRATVLAEKLFEDDIEEICKQAIDQAKRGFEVLCYRTHKLFDWIHSGRGDGTYKKKMEQIIKLSEKT